MDEYFPKDYEMSFEQYNYESLLKKLEVLLNGIANEIKAFGFAIAVNHKKVSNKNNPPNVENIIQFFFSECFIILNSF